MSDLPLAALLNGVSVVGFVAGLGWMLAKGWLSTGAEVTRTIALYTLRIADLEQERDEWKTAAQASKAQVDTLLPALDAIRQGQQVVTAFIEALPKGTP